MLLGYSYANVASHNANASPTCIWTWIIIRQTAYRPRPFAPHPLLSIHIIKLTYCNYQLKFPITTTTQKLHKFKNLILHLQNIGWQTLPPIVITFSIHNTIHQPLVNLLFDLHILKPLMANLFANTVQYLTHLILNKVKLENNNHQSLSPNSPLPHLLFEPTY